MGLELGADDYLNKRFSPRELLARVRTVLRRAQAATPAQARAAEIRAFRFAEFELNLRTRRLVRRDGGRIELSNLEFNLLAVLLASPQRVMTRDQLLEASRVYDNGVRSGDRYSDLALAAQDRGGCYPARLHHYRAQRRLFFQRPGREGLLTRSVVLAPSAWPTAQSAVAWTIGRISFIGALLQLRGT